ncbi:unnamed protein product [Amoebophrya sp. A25]|nr:unnamed protein product [Amoebophrya sp. A25]|eukprot:GSA25T00008248001.1
MLSDEDRAKWWLATGSPGNRAPESWFSGKYGDYKRHLQALRLQETGRRKLQKSTEKQQRLVREQDEGLQKEEDHGITSEYEKVAEELQLETADILEKSDIWALGVMFWRLLLGEPRYMQRDRKTAAEPVIAHADRYGYDAQLEALSSRYHEFLGGHGSFTRTEAEDCATKEIEARKTAWLKLPKELRELIEPDETFVDGYTASNVRSMLNWDPVKRPSAMECVTRLEHFIKTYFAEGDTVERPPEEDEAKEALKGLRRGYYGKALSAEADKKDRKEFAAKVNGPLRESLYARAMDKGTELADRDDFPHLTSDEGYEALGTYASSDIYCMERRKRKELVLEARRQKNLQKLEAEKNLQHRAEKDAHLRAEPGEASFFVQRQKNAEQGTNNGEHELPKLQIGRREDEDQDPEARPKEDEQRRELLARVARVSSEAQARVSRVLASYEKSAEEMIWQKIYLVNVNQIIEKMETRVERKEGEILFATRSSGITNTRSKSRTSVTHP